MIFKCTRCGKEETKDYPYISKKGHNYCEKCYYKMIKEQEPKK